MPMSIFYVWSKHQHLHGPEKTLSLDRGCNVPAGAICGLIGAQLVFNLRHKDWTGPGTLYHKEMKTERCKGAIRH